MPISRTTTVVTLGLAQTLSWASSYYLPAILAAPMARDLGVTVATAFAAFSVGLVISAFLGPRAGRAQVSTRIRLADSQKVTAIARLSDDTFWSATADVVVTLAACTEEAI